MQVSDYSPEKLTYLHQKSHSHGTNKLITEDILNLMTMDMLTWQQKNISLKDMWRLTETKFIKRQKQPVEFVDWSFNFRSPGVELSSDEYATVRGAELRKRIGKDWPHQKE